MSHDIRSYFGPPAQSAGRVVEVVDLVTPPASKRPKRAATREGSLEVVTLDSDDDQPPERKARRTTKSKRIDSTVDRPFQPKKLEQWAEKHRPEDVNALLGQLGEQSAAKKLLRWLREWPRHHRDAPTASSKPKAAVGMGASEGNAFKAALLSGPPGVGKSTAARLVCAELGLECVEVNGADLRGKRLEQKVGESLHSQNLGDFFGPRSTKPKVVSKRGHKITSVLIVDQVDGMSGGSERSGIPELITMIKNCEIPIVCICNERHGQKMQSLAAHCFDLRFERPASDELLARLMAIASLENMRVSEEKVERLIQASNRDLRRSIFALQLLAASRDQSGDLLAGDLAGNPFEVARLLLSPQTSLKEKRELFSVDPSLMPLFVHESYLKICPSSCESRAQLRAQASAAESLAIGDLMNQQARIFEKVPSLPFEASLLCVLPPSFSNGEPERSADFPQSMAEHSKGEERSRLLHEFHSHAGHKMSGPLHAISVDYVPRLRERLLRPLLEEEVDIEETVEVYREYEMLFDDFETLNELGMWSEEDDLWAKVAPRTRSALNRALNKAAVLPAYSMNVDLPLVARPTGSRRAAAQSAQKRLKEIADHLGADDNEEADEGADQKENEIETDDGIAE